MQATFFLGSNQNVKYETDGSKTSDTNGLIFGWFCNIYSIVFDFWSIQSPKIHKNYKFSNSVYATPGNSITIIKLTYTLDMSHPYFSLLLRAKLSNT